MSSSVSDCHVILAFFALHETANERAKKLHHFESENLFSSSDEEQNSTPPIFDSFLDSFGAKSIHRMCTFTPNEVYSVHDQFQTVLNSIWIQVRGKRSESIIFDVFFMTCTVFKNSAPWKFCAAVFKTHSLF